MGGGVGGGGVGVGGVGGGGMVMIRHGWSETADAHVPQSLHPFNISSYPIPHTRPSAYCGFQQRLQCL